MLKTLFKSSIFTLLLTLMCTQIVYAGTKVYQYDGKLPFVEMMLNMMVAMGILDRLPANSRYGGYGLNAYPSSALPGYSNTYLRAMALRGLSPGSSLLGGNNYLERGNTFGNNPLLSSPWMQSPWSQSSLNTPGANALSPLWGSPSWGVLPSYGNTSNYYSPYGTSTDLTGWVNEPWESSTWNPRAEIPQQREKPAASNAPIVQNFNYNLPEGARRNSSQVNANSSSGRKPRSSPLEKLVPSGPKVRSQMKPQYKPSDGDYTAQSKKRSPLWKRTNQDAKSKPCVTEFCGLTKPDINGLWVSKSGELLGIKGQRFFWSDGESRYLKGQIKIQNEYLLAYVDDHEKLMRYKYKLAGDQLLTMTTDGVIREFVRMPYNQYYGGYQGGY